jgi:hypothetical protein
MLELFVMPLAFVATMIIELSKASWNEMASLDWLLLPGVRLFALAGLTGLALYILPRFLKKKRNVPILMQVFYVAMVGMGILVAIVKCKQSGSNVSDETVRLLRSGALTLLGMSYFIKSKRVKETFIV